MGLSHLVPQRGVEADLPLVPRPDLVPEVTSVKGGWEPKEVGTELRGGFAGAEHCGSPWESRTEGLKGVGKGGTLQARRAEGPLS